MMKVTDVPEELPVDYSSFIFLNPLRVFDYSYMVCNLGFVLAFKGIKLINTVDFSAE